MIIRAKKKSITTEAEMAQFLRTATPSGDWRSFKFTHAESGVAYEEGKLYKIQDAIGVLTLDIQYGSQGEKLDKEIESGDEGVLIYHAEKINVYKLTGTGESFSPGDKVYWSGTQGASVTPNYQTGYYWIGIAVRAAGESDELVMIDLKGDKASLTEPL
ncbi:MAG: DUF2190 family protein [Candidatus Hodarchaeales archaeon]